MESPAYQKMGLELMDLVEDRGAKNAFVFSHDRSFYFEALKRDELDRDYLKEIFELVEEEIDVEILRGGKKAEVDSTLDGPPEAGFFLISFAGDYFAALIVKSEECQPDDVAAFKKVVEAIESELEEILLTDSRHLPPTFAF